MPRIATDPHEFGRAVKIRADSCRFVDRLYRKNSAQGRKDSSNVTERLQYSEILCLFALNSCF